MVAGVAYSSTEPVVVTSDVAGRAHGLSCYKTKLARVARAAEQATV